MHTIPFSTDSGMVFSEVWKKKEESGLGLVLTEHMDYDFPTPEFFFDADEYFKTYEPYRSDTLLLGVETGLMCSTKEKNRRLVRSHPFDMVIGSIHVVCGIDIYEQSYFDLFSGKKEAFTTYLEAMLENVRGYGDFDTLGHIDYIARTAPYEDPLLYYEEYKELLDQILKELVSMNKSLEVNTRLFDNAPAVKALGVICRRFTELGGQTCTIGSDAHRAEAIGSNLAKAYAFAETCGLTPVYYKERKPYPAR